MRSIESQPAGLTPRYNANVKCRLFNTLAGVSLVLCVATAVVWIRSYWQSDLISASRQRSWELTLDRGEFDFSIETLYPYSGAPITGKLLGDIFAGPSNPFSDQWMFLHTSSPAYNSTYPSTTLGFGRVNRFTTRTAYGAPSIVSSEATYGVQWLFPAWLVVAVTASLPACRIYATASRRKTKKRIENHQCIRCGYDLRATPHRCPECGHLLEKVKSIL